ncbi:protein NRT1/ PTR FAMILY 5.5 [Citrus sinensis]|uniref:Protein NRT1/ PTR FAMILY 5.5 n=1 Tax=Citrus sinensis TaxID=2711 RepID=A0ACB8JV68_CITSI|nr:protein NRT1/ PTR FAMILY 5.5 [Citrus sinensis]
MMMDYLTEVWMISFVHAAGIVNIFWGTAHVLPLAIRYLVDTTISKYWMILVSSFAYTAGMCLLTMSTPPAIAGAMGTCSDYKPECIGEGQKILLYTALGLIAFGISGHMGSIDRCPRHASELYERSDINDLYVVPHSRSLRWLDKAAIILPNKTLRQQERNRWRLCSVTEVEETKCLVHLIPICFTFIIPGVVSSIGNTFFLEQAEVINGKDGGNFSFGPLLLLLFYYISKGRFTAFYEGFVGHLTSVGWNAVAHVVGFAMSMILSILCCVTAAIVETRRLDVVRSHGLIDKPDEKIPMSLFWLLPQFLLLGAADGFYEKGIDMFFSDQFPRMIFRYLKYIFVATMGVGIIGSTVSVYYAGIVSERIGKHNWFQDTLNLSRLDNYYWLLAALTAANLAVLIIAAMRFPYNYLSLEQIDIDDGPLMKMKIRACRCTYGALALHLLGILESFASNPATMVAAVTAFFFIRHRQRHKVRTLRCLKKDVSALHASFFHALLKRSISNYAYLLNVNYGWS